jgi:hypothetical protein
MYKTKHPYIKEIDGEMYINKKYLKMVVSIHKKKMRNKLENLIYKFDTTDMDKSEFLQKRNQIVGELNRMGLYHRYLRKFFNTEQINELVNQ